MKIKKGYIILSIPVIVAAAAIFFLLTDANARQKTATGIVETTEIDLATKIPGRIESIFFKEGMPVKKGDIIAHLESKEMDAKLEQARGMMEAARSKMILTNKGAREQEKRGTEKIYLQAKHQYEYVARTRERYIALFADSVISAQEMDEIEFKYNAALEQMEAARAKYDMVIEGARPEEKKAARALFHQAENGFNEVIAYVEELIVKAPIDGEISNVIADEGEIIAAGYPIVSVMDKDGMYVVLQIREDELNYYKIGKSIAGRVPAFGNEEHNFKVSYIAPMADFATWKPTNQKGDFDLKTFEIHLKSESQLNNLRPGMTVNFVFSEQD